MKKGNMLLKSVIGIVAPTTILLPVVLTTTSCSNNSDSTSSNTYIREFYTENSRTTFMGVSATSSQEDRTITFTYAAASSDGVNWEIENINSNYNWEDYFTLNISDKTATLVLNKTFEEAPTADNLFPPQYLAFNVIVSGSNKKQITVYLDNYYFFDPNNSSSVTLNENVDTRYIPPYPIEEGQSNPYNIYDIVDIDKSFIDLDNWLNFTSDISVSQFHLQQGSYAQETLLNYLFISGEYTISGSTTYPIHMPADFSKVDLSTPQITFNVESFTFSIIVDSPEGEVILNENMDAIPSCAFDIQQTEKYYQINVNTENWDLRSDIEQWMSLSYNITLSTVGIEISYSTNLTDQFTLSQTFTF